MELLVSKVLEDKISEVDDIHNIFSSSVEGASFVRVEIKKGAPIDQRMQQIRMKIQEARLLMPAETSEPDVDDRVLRTNTMVLVLVSQEIPPVTLKEQAKELKRRLEGMQIVGKVELLGEAQEEIEVAVDVTALSHQGISLSQVVPPLPRPTTTRLSHPRARIGIWPPSPGATRPGLRERAPPRFP